MRLIYTGLLSLLMVSCIPTKIAPNIKTYKIVQGKKFHKNLFQYAFVFKDPKDAYEFYNYVNIVYELNDTNVDTDVPIVVDNRRFFFSSREAEKTTETLNLVPIVADAKLADEGYGPYMESVYKSRSGHWYIVITVRDENGKDALNPEHGSRNSVTRYLNQLRKTYLKHHNYHEVLFNKNPD